ncbi:hypothetical protein ABZT34_34905 [Streptomyces sp. NPDC005329]|uniref:hypothetical protein n=1 Tax=Streptomyces sp. NPDC005329 TaxID=3157034 RepID=UPI0033A8E071
MLITEALGPGLLIALCITWGRPGWYVVGVMFALTGLTAGAARAAEEQPAHFVVFDLLRLSGRTRSPDHATA